MNSVHIFNLNTLAYLENVLKEDIDLLKASRNLPVA